MSDYELLELALFTAILRRDVKRLAKAIIAWFGSFAEVLAAPPERLGKVPLRGRAAGLSPLDKRRLQIARSLAAALCMQALALREDRTVERGPLPAMIAAPQDPYTAALLDAVPPPRKPAPSSLPRNPPAG